MESKNKNKNSRMSWKTERTVGIIRLHMWSEKEPNMASFKELEPYFSVKAWGRIHVL